MKNKEKPKFLQINWQLIQDKNTSLQEKIILCEINNLSKNRKCFAKNEHFSTRLNINKTSVSRSISSLEKKGYINTSIKPKSRNFDRTITINNLLITINNGLTTDNKLLFDLLTICIESKENIETTNIEFNNSYPDKLNIDAWELWTKYKKEKKQGYKPMGEKTAIKKLIVLDKKSQLDCIEHSISNNYSGFFTEKFTGANNGHTKSTTRQLTPFEQRMEQHERTAERLAVLDSEALANDARILSD